MIGKSKIDWEGIEREYRAGQLSIRGIAKQYGVSDTAIRKRAKAEHWERDLTKKVQERVRSDLVRSEVRIPHAREVSPERLEDDIIEEAAKRGVEVIRSHRKDILKLRELSYKLMAEVEKNKEFTALVGKGEKATAVKVRMSTKEKSEVLRNISQALHRAIPLERQAFNLDATSGDEDAPDAISITYYRQKA